jgi:hypothetical protein
MNPHSYAHLIFDKDAKDIGCRKLLLEKVVIFLQMTETKSLFITLY